ncbi:MAG: ribosomal protein S18-alanine N-acetyltransferase [Gallionellaceae bacterium]|nr:ribosomal protein S18-alanine N-acetyltransferase [Gallionellaceae bacterium]
MILRDMTEGDIDSVLSIEQKVHSHPWTRGNFNDSLTSGYVCKVAEMEEQIMGYAILMQGVDDAELLDIAIAAPYQRRGLGRVLLKAMLMRARELGKKRVVLEVRKSSVAAVALYQAVQFDEMGVRRDYYPAKNGREDAILMEWKC